MLEFGQHDACLLVAIPLARYFARNPIIAAVARSRLSGGRTSCTFTLEMSLPPESHGS
jgi:hypothetical protein